MEYQLPMPQTPILSTQSTSLASAMPSGWRVGGDDHVVVVVAREPQTWLVGVYVFQNI